MKSVLLILILLFMTPVVRSGPQTTFIGEEGGETTPYYVGSWGVGPGHYVGRNGTRSTLGNFQLHGTMNVLEFTLASNGTSRVVSGTPNFTNPNTVESFNPVTVGGVEFKGTGGRLQSRVEGGSWVTMSETDGQGLSGEAHPDL